MPGLPVGPDSSFTLLSSLCLKSTRLVLSLLLSAANNTCRVLVVQKCHLVHGLRGDNRPPGASLIKIFYFFEVFFICINCHLTASSHFRKSKMSVFCFGTSLLSSLYKVRMHCVFEDEDLWTSRNCWIPRGRFPKDVFCLSCWLGTTMSQRVGGKKRNLQLFVWAQSCNQRNKILRSPGGCIFFFHNLPNLQKKKACVRLHFQMRNEAPKMAFWCLKSHNLSRVEH